MTLKRIMSCMLMCVLAVTLAVATPVEVDAAAKCRHNHTSYPVIKRTVEKTKSKGTTYSDWKSANDIYTARSNGEGGIYSREKTKSVTTSGNISTTITVPEAELTAEIGITVEEKITSSIIGSYSRPLKKGESCRYYYRESWKVYDVTEKWAHFCKDCKKVVGYKYVQKNGVKIPQKITSKDQGWKYGKAKDLKKTVTKL